MFETTLPQFVSETTQRGQQVSLRFEGSGLWQAPRVFWQFATVVAIGWGGLVTLQLCLEHGVGLLLPGAIVSLVAGPGVIFWVLTFLGRAPAEISVVGRQLRVQETRVLYTRRRCFEAHEIASIEMGNSRVGCGEDCPLPELQIRLHDGKKFGVLRGRTPQLIDQTARWLCEALNVRMVTAC